MATFLKNFRENNERILRPYIPSLYSEELNLPDPTEEMNVENWRYRVAVPFSYKTSGDGKRQYGVIYAPESEAKKFFNSYDESGKVKPDYNNITIYGAELTNGPSLTAKGFMNLFDKVKNSDFKLEKDMAADVSSSSKQNLNQGTVPVTLNPIFKNLREALRIFQKKGEE